MTEVNNPQRPAVVPSAAQSTNGLAIASLATSIGTYMLLPVVGGLIGVGFGVAAISQIKDTPQAGRGLAIAGIVTGLLQVIIYVGSFIVWLALMIGLVMMRSH